MFDTAVYETLMLALDEGAVTLPEEGRILFLRAELSPHLARLPKERLICQNSFKPAARDRDLPGHTADPAPATPPEG